MVATATGSIAAECVCCCRHCVAPRITRVAPHTSPSHIPLPLYHKAPKFLLGPIAGLDLAGVVESIGEGVDATHLSVGDEVFGRARGALADLVVAKATSLARKPRALTMAQAAAMPTTYLTALQGLRDYGGLQAGGKVLVIGASGGCGTAIVQVAAALGAAEIVGVCSGRNAELVRRLGATRVVDYTQESLAEAFGGEGGGEGGGLRSVPNESKFDVIFDAATGSGGGEDYKAQSKALLYKASRAGAGWSGRGSGTTSREGEEEIEGRRRGDGQYVAINGGAGMWIRYVTGFGQKKGEHLFLTKDGTEDLEQLTAMVNANNEYNGDAGGNGGGNGNGDVNNDDAAEAGVDGGAGTGAGAGARGGGGGAGVDPIISHVFPFTAQHVEEGFAMLKSRRAVGKIVFDLTAGVERAGRDIIAASSDIIADWEASLPGGEGARTASSTRGMIEVY